MKLPTLKLTVLALVLMTATSCDYFSVVEPPSVEAPAVDEDAGDGSDVSKGLSEVLIDVSGEQTSEAGQSVTIEVSLSRAPSSLVLVRLVSSDSSEITIDRGDITFTPERWDEPQVALVTGVDDMAADGDQVISVDFDVVVSDDPTYDGITPPSVELTNLDGVCGNGVTDGAEECDSPSSDVCEDVEGDCLFCLDSCSYDRSPRAPTCGDGIVNQESEQCDAPGTLSLCRNGRSVVSCASDCSIPTEGCAPRLDIGEFGGCFIQADGSVVCWGEDAAEVATPPEGLQARQLSVQGTSACAIDSNSNLVCWGDAESISAPGGLALFQVDVSVAPSHACTLDDAGTARCFGDNTSGQSMAPDTEFVQVEVSATQSCGLKTDGLVECWGAATARARPAPDRAFLRIAGAKGLWCGLTRETGEILCWGEPSEVGAGGEVLMVQGMGFRDLDVGPGTVCGLTGDDSPMVCEALDGSEVSTQPLLNSNDIDLLAVGEQTACVMVEGAVECTFDPVHIGRPGVDFQKLASYSGCACGITDTGKLRCAGNGPGVCPTTELKDKDVTEIAMKGQGGCVIESSGALTCWYEEQMGPANVYSLTLPGVTKVAVHGQKVCALDMFGGVTCWNKGRPNPGPSGSFVDVSMGANFSCGVLSTGRLDCWSLTGAIIPSHDIAQNVVDVEVYEGGGCVLDSTGRIACFGNVGIDYTSPDRPLAFEPGFKSLCFLETNTRYPRCFSAAKEVDTRFGGARLELFTFAQSMSYAVPEGGLLVWRKR